MPDETVGAIAGDARRVQWFAVAIPRFSQVRDGLNKVMGNHANKPKKGLKQKGHELQWTDEGIQSWNRFKKLLEISS